MSPIPIHLVIEDALSESVVRKIFSRSKNKFAIGHSYGKEGVGFIKKNIKGFNHAAKGTPFLILVDLDRHQCPSQLTNNWLVEPKHHNLLFRVAVCEVESWVLAHREGFAKYLGIKTDLIPNNVDSLPDPKQFLIDLAKRAKKKTLREDIVPPISSMRKQGPNYNGALIYFIEKFWDLESAICHSHSLKRTVNVLNKFIPFWKGS